MIRNQTKHFDQMKHFDKPTCLILYNMDYTISTVTGMNEATALQLSAVVDNGLIHWMGVSVSLTKILFQHERCIFHCSA